jgi:1-acyl-sn-glycerol-3-phosphate acyltransferase
MASQPHGRLSIVLRTIAGVAVLVAVCSSCVLCLLFLVPWRGARIRVSNFFGHLLGQGWLAILGVKTHFTNREGLNPDRPAVYVFNHCSALDFVLGMWLCPIGGCGVIKKELADSPVLGWTYKLSGHLSLQRTDKRGSIAALQEVAKDVRRYGLSIWMSPEGTRGTEGALLPFKKGFAHLAMQSGLPVVPVVIRGSQKLWPRGLQIASGEVLVDVLEPIDTSGWTPETVEEHVAEVRAHFERVLQSPA